MNTKNRPQFLLAKILRKVGISKYLNYSVRIKLNDRYVAVPIVEGDPESLLSLETDFKSKLLHLFQGLAETGFFVDIGANNGQSMLEVFSHNKSVKYFGFEPSPKTFSILQRVAKANGVDAQLFPWACSSNSHPVKLFSTSLVDPGATIIPEIRPDTYENVSGFWISAYPFDLISEKLGLPINFIMKIDVEGSELNVIQGSLDTISKYKPFIICEILHAHRQSEMRANNENKEAIEQVLRELNYDIYLCNLDKKIKNNLVKLEKIESFPKNLLWSESPDTCDYVFVPKEKSVAF